MMRHRRTLVAALLSLTLVAASARGDFLQVSPAARLTADGWEWSQQTPETIRASLDFGPWICPGKYNEDSGCPVGTGSLTGSATWTVKVIGKSTTLNALVSSATLSGTSVKVTVDGSQALDQTSYEIDIIVSALDGSGGPLGPFTWPLRVDFQNVHYRP